MGPPRELWGLWAVRENPQEMAGPWEPGKWRAARGDVFLLAETAPTSGWKALYLSA